jgi:hypothetical protein
MMVVAPAAVAMANASAIAIVPLAVASISNTPHRPVASTASQSAGIRRPSSTSVSSSIRPGLDRFRAAAELGLLGRGDSRTILSLLERVGSPALHAVALLETHARQLRDDAAGAA